MGERVESEDRAEAASTLITMGRLLGLEVKVIPSTPVVPCVFIEDEPFMPRSSFMEYGHQAGYDRIYVGKIWKTLADIAQKIQNPASSTATQLTLSGIDITTLRIIDKAEQIPDETPYIEPLLTLLGLCSVAKLENPRHIEGIGTTSVEVVQAIVTRAVTPELLQVMDAMNDGL